MCFIILSKGTKNCYSRASLQTFSQKTLQTMAEVVIAPTYWISWQVLSILFTVIHLFIVKHEIKKRKNPSAKFTTKSLKYTSISCIVSGFLANISWLLQWFNGLCLFMPWLGSLFMYIQYLSMGFYQLSRLYYSFANNQIHSDKGYPIWIFIIMVIFGIFSFFSYSISTMFERFAGLNIKCGINSNFESYWRPIINTHQSFIDFSIYGSMLLYIIWDLGTLLMYIAKIRLFKEYKHSQPIVYKRILSILYKITIMTLFYDMLFLMGVALSFFLFIPDSDALVTAALIPRLGTLLYGVSMMLMMDYNSSLYGKFLQIIYKFKLHFCFCCCRFMILEQLKEMEEENMNQMKQQEVEKSIETKTIQTRDCQDTKMGQIGGEMSVSIP